MIAADAAKVKHRQHGERQLHKLGHLNIYVCYVYYTYRTHIVGLFSLLVGVFVVLTHNCGRGREMKNREHGKWKLDRLQNVEVLVQVVEERLVGDGGGCHEKSWEKRHSTG